MEVKEGDEEVVVLDSHRLYPAGKMIHIFDISQSTVRQAGRFWSKETKPADYLSVWAGNFKFNWISLTLIRQQIVFFSHL